MEAISIYDAKANLSKLVDRAQRGETTVITKHGKPAAFVTPIAATDKVKIQRSGFFKGRYAIPEGFDTLAQDEILALFEGDGS